MANYEYWQKALAGEFGEVHEGDPQPGFYRKRTRKAGPFVPVAIFEHEGDLVALVDGRQADAAEIWTYVCQNPIPEQWYRDKVDGKPWPDEDETVTTTLQPPAAGHNGPPADELDIIRDQIEAASAGVDAYETISDDETAAKAQSLRARLNELSREADKKREALKRPHLEAGKAVDAAWQPLVKAAKGAADRIAKALGAHETRKAREAEKKRREEEEARRKLEEAARAADPAMQAPPPPQEQPAPEPVTAIRGAYGRAASVKVVKIATVTDQDAAYGYLKGHKELVDLIARLAQRATDAGYTVPGVDVAEERRVA